MKGFVRDELLVSLCGLNCALCPMQVGGYCPGCGGGEGNQSCAIARCSLNHGGIQFCFPCTDYPLSHFATAWRDTPIRPATSSWEYLFFLRRLVRFCAMQFF